MVDCYNTLRLIIDYLAVNNLTLLPLFHVSKSISEVVRDHQEELQPYKRRLFYNLSVKGQLVTSSKLVRWYQGQGGHDITLIHEACRLGSISTIKELSVQINFFHLQLAAGHKHLKFVQEFWLQKEAGWILGSAAFGGSLELFQWVEERNRLGRAKLPQSAIMARAAEAGHLHIVKYLSEKEADHEPAFKSAVTAGHLEIVEYLYSLSPTIYGIEDAQHLHMIQWLMSKGATPTYYSMMDACRSGNVPLMQFLYNKVQLSKDYLASASEYGNFDAVKLLISWGLKPINQIFSDASQYGNIEIFEWGLENLFITLETEHIANAARCGHFGLVKWLLAHGCPLDRESSIFMALQGDHCEIANWLRVYGETQGVPQD